MSKRTRKPLTAQAVEQGMEQHDGLVHAFIRRQGRGDIPYDDALQAGRIGIWRAIEGYDPKRGTTFSTYAWVAIMRHIHQAAEGLNRELGTWSGEVSTSWEQVLPEDWVEQVLILEALRELVGRLPEWLQQVVARYGMGDEPPRTLRDVGTELGFSGERIRQLQQDALAWLRHPAHSVSLRQLLGRNTAADYRRALAENAALRRRRRGRHGTVIVAPEVLSGDETGSFTHRCVPSGTVSSGGELIVTDLAPGTYTSTEVDPTSDFELTEVACDDGGECPRKLGGCNDAKRHLQRGPRRDCPL
jgi:RNA polymerase sigma factor (sigma-70 family)